MNKSFFGKTLALSAVLASVAGAGWMLANPAPAEAKPVLEVYKSPSCGCCGEWVKHMQDNGFSVKIHDTGNSQIRTQMGISPKYGSCHTAVIDGYAVEGHTPASEVKRLLAERPDAVGIAVPAMPIGSPGMDGEAYRGRKDPYDVLLLGKNGTHSVYQSYP